MSGFRGTKIKVMDIKILKVTQKGTKVEVTIKVRVKRMDEYIRNMEDNSQLNLRTAGVTSAGGETLTR